MVYRIVLVPEIEFNESLETDAFGNDDRGVLNSIRTIGAILTDHSARNNSGKVVGIHKHCIQSLPSDILPVNI
jgi:hypothetical protein